MTDMPTGTCDGGGCDRPSVSMAYQERLDALIPVCRRHILTYRVEVRGRLTRAWWPAWQVEDEWLDLPRCRRSRSRFLAQWLMLHDQRLALRGKLSQHQARQTRTARKDTTND